MSIRKCMFKKLLFSFVFITLFAHANKPEQSISLNRGQTTTVSIPSNPTTGYSWQLCSKNTRNTIVGIKELPYTPDKTGLVGSGATQSWEITGNKRGQARIKFEYRRPWEKGAAPAQIKRYLFTVS
jgi:predicted secreted protein